MYCLASLLQNYVLPILQLRQFQAAASENVLSLIRNFQAQMILAENMSVVQAPIINCIDKIDVYETKAVSL